MIVTEENGEYYCYGKIMSKEEILKKELYFLKH